jgi:hypothetical protein
MRVDVFTSGDFGLDEERIHRNTLAIVDLLHGSGASYLEAVVTVAMLKERFIQVMEEDEGGNDGLPVE